MKGTCESSNYPPSNWQVTLLPPLTALSPNSAFGLVFLDPPERSLACDFTFLLNPNANTANPRFAATADQAEVAPAVCHRDDSKTKSKPPCAPLFFAQGTI